MGLSGFATDGWVHGHTPKADKGDTISLPNLMFPARTWAMNTKGGLYWSHDRDTMIRFIGLSNHLGYRQWWLMDGSHARAELRDLIAEYGGTCENTCFEVTEERLALVEAEVFLGAY